MRPDMGEQLEGTCRILEQVVAPCVNDPFARTILDNLVANLRMLVGAMPGVAAFLRDDNQASAALLATLQATLSPELAQRVADTLAKPAPDAADSKALDIRNTALRALLSEAICSPGLTPSHHQAIRRHLSERAARVPMRYVPTVAAKPAGNAPNVTSPHNAHAT
ncbi:MAG: hypothetical protein RL458_504 [Pseudomonadota bacterium]